MRSRNESTDPSSSARLRMTASLLQRGVPTFDVVRVLHALARIDDGSPEKAIGGLASPPSVHRLRLREEHDRLSDGGDFAAPFHVGRVDVDAVGEDDART